MSNKYDVAIIGAGMGGLVSGCYLAKKGLKIIIIEKNAHPGGLCTSFKRGTYTFDTGIRGLVGAGDGGYLGRVINELNIKIKITRSPIFDLIVLPDYKIALKNNPSETKEGLKSCFPKEAKNIELFFNFLLNPNFLELYAVAANKNYSQILDVFFKDPRLKTFWNILRAETGLLPSDTSAMAGLNLCRGFLLDGGYYPIGGMQALPNAFLDAFKNSGGQILLSRTVKKIKISGSGVKGVILDDGYSIESKHVISDCDALQTFCHLVEKKYVKTTFRTKLNKMVPSLSAFIVFLGVRKSYKKIVEKCCALWYFSRYLNNKEYDIIHKFDLEAGYVICVFPSFQDPNLSPRDGDSIYLYVGAPFKNENFWTTNKMLIADRLIKLAENVLPDLSRNIVVMETASPATFYRWTLNQAGASRGWAVNTEQTNAMLMPVKTFIPGLFLSSHWSTSAIGNGGISAVAYSGRQVAKTILSKH
jgi:all-trans-retinol 13,14-reductase